MNFVTIIYERSGDFGLTFFLVILIINLYSFWGSIPKRIETHVTPDKLRASHIVLNLLRILLSLAFGIFSLAIVLAPGPALWLKIFGAILTGVLFILLLSAMWALTRIVIG
jgi:hypothetical protein